MSSSPLTVLFPWVLALMLILLAVSTKPASDNAAPTLQQQCHSVDGWQLRQCYEDSWWWHIH